MRGGRKGNFLAAFTLAVVLLAGSFTSGSVAASEWDERPIVASNAVVVDAESGEVLFEQGMDEAVAPASLTKILTAIVALESAAPATEMTVDGYDLVGEASIGLYEGEETTLETLLYGLMLTSGNDAAMTIARELGELPGDTPQESVSRFMERVNATADRLGLSNTNLKNPHGLDQSGHESSAADIAAISAYALRNPIFREIISTPYHAAGGREFYNMNELMDFYPGLIGGKPGITDDAGYCLMQVAERDGKTVLVVLLGSTREAWYADATYLLDLGFEELRQNPEDDSRPVVGLAGRTSIDVPEVSSEVSVGGSLSVDRVSDREAVVRANSIPTERDSLGWRWPLVSLAVMGVALVLALNLPAIMGLGALAVHRGSRLQLTPPAVPSFSGILKSVMSLVPSTRPRGRIDTKRRRQPPMTPSRSESPSTERWAPRPGGHTMADEPPASTSLTPARSRAEQAIKLAMQSRYHAATDEFRKALELDPAVDLSTCPGFWRMQPMGYISAAKAYKLNGQAEDGRVMLTGVRLAFKSNSELSGLFARAIRLLDD